MHDASQGFLPITDWSIEGRKNYLNRNIVTIEQILSTSLEVFYGPKISSIFGSQEKAKEKILSMFVSEGFDHNKLPSGVSCDSRLFSHLDFWCKLKTGRYIAGAQHTVVDETVLGGYSTEESNIEHDVEKLSNCLMLYSHFVAPDIVGFWLMANKKLLDELGGVFSPGESVNKVVKGSPSKQSKYKADASFRYLCLYLNVDSKVSEFHKYKNKYLTRGENKPQYVADGIETHREKYEARKAIAYLINYFHRVKNDEPSPLCQRLLKVAGRTSLLDLYEIGNDFIHYEKLKNQLLELKSPSKKEAQNVAG